MTGRTGTTRRSRTRALIVGRPDDVLISPANELPGITYAQDLFDAIGCVATSSAREPIGLVLIHLDSIEDLVSEAILALRRVDPSIDILGVACSRAAASVNGSIRAQLDEVVRGPINTQVLDDLLAGRIDSDAVSTNVPDHKAAPDTRATASGQPTPSEVVNGEHESPREPIAANPKPQPAQPPKPTDRSPIKTREKSASPADVQPAAGDEPPAQSDGEGEDVLGDIDLVEAIMDRPGTVHDLAIRLMRQQTGWQDVAFYEQAPQLQPGQYVEVSYGDRRFGVLCSNEAPPKQLAMWAHWLSTWLALDQDQNNLRLQASRDHLTGAWNRRYFYKCLNEIISEAREKRQPVTIMVFDIDDFKQYNDRFGHHAGDEILVETVRLLNSVIRDTDRVCRIGGDEFAVIFWEPEGPREPGSTPPESVETIARRFQEQICKMRFPKLASAAPGTLSISAGLSTFPWDGNDPVELLRHADQLALESKRKGKNVLTFGPGTQRICNGDEGKNSS